MDLIVQAEKALCSILNIKHYSIVKYNDHLYNKMKKFILLFVIYAFVRSKQNYSTLEISITSTLFTDGKHGYILNSHNGKGNIIYSIEGFPSGTILQYNRIYLPEIPKYGTYEVIVKGVDANGLKGQKKMTFKIDTNNRTYREDQRQSIIVLEHHQTQSKPFYVQNLKKNQDQKTKKDKQESQPQSKNKKPYLKEEVKNQVQISSRNRDLQLKFTQDKHSQLLKQLKDLSEIFDERQTKIQENNKILKIYQLQYNQILQAKKRYEKSIPQSQNKIEQISSAKNGLQELLIDAKNEIKKAITVQGILNKSKQNMIGLIKDKQIKKEEFQSELEEEQGKFDKKMIDFDKLKQVCQNIENYKKQTQQSKKQVQNEINSLKQELNRTKTQIQQKQQLIENLRNQLKNAEQSLTTLKKKQTEISQKQIQNLKTIQSLQDEIESFSERKKLCQKSLNFMKAEVDELEEYIQTKYIKGLQNYNEMIKENKKILSDLNEELKNTTTTIQQKSTQIAIDEKDLKFLNQQLSEAQAQYQQRKTHFQLTKEELNKMKVKLAQVLNNRQKQSERLNQLQEEIKELKIQEEFLRLSLGDRKKPIKNYIKVQNFTSFVYSKFGKEIEVFDQSISRVYPFTFYDQISDEKCSEEGDVKYLKGEIVQIFDDSVVLRFNKHKISLIKLLPCTQLVSNLEDYHIRIGDLAIVKGIINENLIKATYILFIR